MGKSMFVTQKPTYYLVVSEKLPTFASESRTCVATKRQILIKKE